MSTALETSVVISSSTGALVVALITGLFIELTVVPISVAEAEITDVAKNISAGDKNSNTTNITVSDEERRKYLTELQSETTRAMIPTITYLVIVAVVGVIGNTLIIVVYRKKFQWTATGFLIVTIAVLDIASNTLSIPSEVYNILNMWDFESSTLCRITRFISVFTTLSSAMMLVAVAVTRYRKVCHPFHWQVTTRMAKVLSFAVYFFGALFSTPFTIVRGLHTKKTRRRNIVGYECATDDEYINTIYPLVIYASYMVLYVVCCLSISVLYTLIGVQAWKHKQIHGGYPCTSVPVTQNAPSARVVSNETDQSVDKNESNCKCGSEYDKKIDTSIEDESSIQNDSHVDEIKMKRFLVRNEANEAPVQYSVRVFTDWIVVRIPAVDEFFVKLQKGKPATVNVPSHEVGEHNNTGNENKIQPGDGPREDTITGEIRMIRSKIHKERIREVKSSLGDVDSNGEYTERCTGQFCNRENKSEAGRTVNTFHSKERSEKSASIFDINILNLYKVVDNDTEHPHSETAATETLNESDPWSMFKWLDVIYCPDEEHTTFDSNYAQRETNPSFKLPLNNTLLQQSQWLRASVVNAIRKRGMTQGKSGGRIINEDSTVDSARYPCHYPEPNSDARTKDTFSYRLTSDLLQNPTEETIGRVSVLTLSPDNQRVNKRPANRTTTMLFIISAFFIFSYLPHFALVLIEFVDADLLYNMSMTARTFYNLALRSVFLNCAVNPFVYSLCDVAFRRECLKLIKCP